MLSSTTTVAAADNRKTSQSQITGFAVKKEIASLAKLPVPLFYSQLFNQKLELFSAQKNIYVEFNGSRVKGTFTAEVFKRESAAKLQQVPVVPEMISIEKNAG